MFLKKFRNIFLRPQQTGKHLRPQQCFRNNVSSFAGALRNYCFLRKDFVTTFVDMVMSFIGIKQVELVFQFSRLLESYLFGYQTYNFTFTLKYRLKL